jgi:phosphate:Na+ symporter
MATPVLAMEALSLELHRAAEMVRKLASGAINIEGQPGLDLAEQEQGLRGLIDAIEQFVINLEMKQLPDSQRGNLPIALRVAGYLEETIGLARSLDEHRTDIETIMRPAVGDAIASYQAAVIDQIRRCDQIGDTVISDLEEGYEDLRVQWHDLKSVLLNAAAARLIPVNPLNSSLEGLRGCLKMAEQLTKAAERIHALSLDDGGDDDDDDEERQEASEDPVRDSA